jgi:small subunit ribosomal protein S17
MSASKSKTTKTAAKAKPHAKVKAHAKAKPAAAAPASEALAPGPAAGAAVAEAAAAEAVPVAAGVVPAEADAPAQTAVLPAPEPRGARTLTGRVVSNKMQKTIAVEIERLVRHPTYGKYIRRTTKLLAHDEDGSSREGDLVVITPCRPMSRHKSWRLLEIVQKAARS